jgi:hypothetical protein
MAANASTRLRKIIKRLPGRQLSVSAPTSGQLSSPGDRTVIPETEQQIDAGRTGGQAQVLLVEHLPTIEQPVDPLRPTIHRATSQSRLARLWRALRRAWARRWELAYDLFVLGPGRTLARARHYNPWRKLSAEEQAQRDEQQRRQKMARLLEREAQLYWDRIVNALDRYGYQHRAASTDGKGGYRPTSHVKFDKVVMQPEAIYFRINTQRLPFGTKIAELMDRLLLIDLSLACQRRVSAEYSERIGAWYVVERAIGTRGIPDHVKYQDLITAMPASADGLTIPIGIGINSKMVYRSLGRMYSMLVAGTIGGGKSNFLNVLLCTLIQRNPPERLKLILVDLKGGLEFQFYAGLPHLIPIPDVAPSGIADHNHQVPGVLEWLHTEGERRQAILRDAGYKSIGRYNAHRRGSRMPHLLLVIDEWADVMYDKGIKSRAEEALANIAQRYRAVGVHVIVCTQVPKSEVISLRIKGVLPAKICFSTPSNQGSMVVLDHGGAKGLTPAGRCILQHDDETEVQTPFINEEMISAVVERAISGKPLDTASGHDVTHIEVLEWALANDNGYLSRDTLHKQFGRRGLKQAELEQWLAEWEGQEIVLGTSLYRVAKAAGSRPRRLIAVDEDADGIPDQPDSQSPIGEPEQ